MDGRARQQEIYVGGVSGVRPGVSTDLTRLEADAERVMSRRAFAYVAGGAGTGATIAANRASFDRRRLVPRMLRDASVRDTSVELFGRRMSAPFMLAPIGVAEMAHRDADLATARAAASEGVGMIFSNQASVAMERCAAEMSDGQRWFQLYWSTSNELVESFVARAEGCGCGRACSGSSRSTRGRRCPGPTSRSCESGRGCRSCSRGSATPTMRGGRSTPGSTGSSSPTTVAAKALALGARAVLLGRPYLYALALAGEDGVRQVLRDLAADIDLTLGLCGCSSLAELTPDLLTTS
jgi:isopentenyl diphosphate isomerase/L-lactate dehydrogenase-like FMN-dependent dehydrogenase